jgi:hypothetical protein
VQPTDWQQMQHKAAGDGRIVLAQRIHQVDLGRKSFLTEQFATWFENDGGRTEMRLFDQRRYAAEDFDSRQ